MTAFDPKRTFRGYLIDFVPLADASADLPDT